MIQFYRVRGPEQSPGTVVVVAEDTEADILLRWVPNTGLWHRATELENDHLFGDEGGTYEPVDAAEAAGLLRQVAPFDERYSLAQRMLARYRAHPPAEQRTNAEMGLTQAQTRMKPMAAPGLGELLRRSARSHRWRTLVRYSPGAGSAPRQFVSDWSRRPHPLGPRSPTGLQRAPPRRPRRAPTRHPPASLTAQHGSLAYPTLPSATHQVDRARNLISRGHPPG